ncbi:MAG: hypothetical protein RQ982_02400 [Gammaproteobacteria bacterium]|nr:hypothetical protein [Gammaproteobacteria bacterium]
MTSETQSDNKTTFGPLAKYATVAVIMVSIIVTTAIMLDKQLNTVDEKLAVINKDLSQTYTAETQTNDEVTTAVIEEKVEIATTTETTTKPSSEVASSEMAVTEVTTADVLVAQEATDADVVSETMPGEALPVIQQTRSTQAAPFKLARNTSEDQQQARIEAFKQQQKQHMTEMFARIKKLEAQQLDQYKAGQESQIDHLRELVAKQQQQIEALELRNKDRYDLRAAHVQRNQSSREEMLNRI